MNLKISISGRTWDSTSCNLVKCMISYFNSGYLIKYLVAFMVACLLWIPSFISPEFGFETKSIFSILNVDIEWLSAKSYIFIWICFLLTFISALAINQILREYNLVNLHNTTSLIVFVLFTSALPLFTSVNSYIIINILLILFIQGILKLSVVEYPITEIFNISFYLGLASLFYTPLIYLLIIIWVAIIINRQTNLRNYLISLSGLLIPYLLFFSWFYLDDTAVDNGLFLLAILSDLNFSVKLDLLTYYDIGILMFLLSVIVLSFLILLGKIGEKSYYVRKNIVVIFYYLAATFLIHLLFSNHPDNLLLLSLPATFIVTIAVYTINKSRILNILFSLLLLCVILNHYYHLLHVKEILFK